MTVRPPQALLIAEDTFSLSLSVFSSWKQRSKIDRYDATCCDWWMKEHRYSKRGGEVIRHANLSCSLHPWFRDVKNKYDKMTESCHFHNATLSFVCRRLFNRPWNYTFDGLKVNEKSKIKKRIKKNNTCQWTFSLFIYFFKYILSRQNLFCLQKP